MLCLCIKVVDIPISVSDGHAASYALQEGVFKRVQLLIIDLLFLQKFFRFAELARKKTSKPSDNKKTTDVEDDGHNKRPRNGNSASMTGGRRGYEERCVTKNRKSRCEEGAAIKEKNGPIHHRQGIEKRKWTGDISSDPDDPCDQKNIEVNLEVREHPQISHAWQKQNRTDGNCIGDKQWN